MSRVSAVLFVWACVLAVPVAGGATDRMVVMEHFTNTSCGPCGTYNPYIKAFVENHKDEMVAVQYHVDWPSPFDPFYRDNMTENDARIDFYGVTSVPHIILDGRTEPVYPYTLGNLETAWDAVVEIPTQLTIHLTGFYDGRDHPHGGDDRGLRRFAGNDGGL
jgi:hypothetical protein